MDIENSQSVYASEERQINQARAFRRLIGAGLAALAIVTPAATTEREDFTEHSNIHLQHSTTFNNNLSSNWAGYSASTPTFLNYITA